MLTWALLVAVLAALLAGVVTGTTGFGLALISTPLLLFVYEPRTVVFLTAVFSVFINTAVVWDSWREAHRKLALALLLPACVGIVAGAEVLTAPFIAAAPVCGSRSERRTLLRLGHSRLPTLGPSPRSRPPWCGHGSS